jgi:hypothetical protein
MQVATNTLNIEPVKCKLHWARILCMQSCCLSDIVNFRGLPVGISATTQLSK